MKLTMTHAGKQYIAMTQEELETAGVPASAIDQAFQAQRIADLKLLCRARIFAQASSETQANMTFFVSVIACKTVAQRSAEETAIIGKAQSVLDWVKAMRTNVRTLAASPDLDPNDDANWPPVPADAVELVAMF